MLKFLKPKESKTRLTLEMPTSTYKKLQASAKAADMPVDNFITRSLATYTYLEEQHRAGGVVLIENLDGSETRLTF